MRTCGKGNSLLPDKQFHFTMVDDNFEELQRSIVPQEMNADASVKLFKDWASSRNHHSSSTIERVSNDIVLTDDHGLLSQWHHHRWLAITIHDPMTSRSWSVVSFPGKQTSTHTKEYMKLFRLGQHKEQTHASFN